MGLLGDPGRDQLRHEHALWARLLGAGETIRDVVRLQRSAPLFTSLRLILVDEGSGRNVEYLSMPYRSITHFSVEADGAFGTDADLRIWVAGRSAPVQRSFGTIAGVPADVFEVQAKLAAHLL